MDAEWEDVGFVYPPQPKKLAPIGSSTLVLVGKTGNGKSATGNSILGTNAFRSKRSSSSVTQTCELATATRSGRLLRVIDTPGQFDTSVDPRAVASEIVKCIQLAEGGIHGILLVLSVCNRFTQEELAAMDGLRSMFGEEVLNYTIVVFTNGDSFEGEDVTLDTFLAGNSVLNDLIRSCGNRKVLFDNKTKDKRKKEEQVKQLLAIVDEMVIQNSQIPYTYRTFEKAKEVQSIKDQEKDLRDIYEERISKLETDVPIKFEKLTENNREYEARLQRLQEDLAKSLREQKDMEEKYNKTREESEKKFEEERQRFKEETEKKFEAERLRFEEERKKFEEQHKLQKEIEERYREERNKSKCIIL